MEFTAAQLAELLEGTITGDEKASVSSLSGIEAAGDKDLTFFYNPEYEKHLYSTQAGIIIIDENFSLKQNFNYSPVLIKVPDARLAFARVLKYYKEYKTAQKTGVHSTAVISDSAKLGKNVYVGPCTFIDENAQIGDDVKIYGHVYIGADVKIGNGTQIHSGVRINEFCLIGSECTFQSGAVIGSDGFGFQPDSANEYEKITHVGNVVVEDRVEIGANTTIDRATFGATLIKKGVKLDNLIQVGHNVEIGENTVIAAQTGIAGSVKIGSNCMIGGQVGFAGHQTIGSGVKIAAQSGVQGDIPDNQIIQGSPAFEIGNFKRSYVMFKKLPDLNHELNGLKKELK